MDKSVGDTAQIRAIGEQIGDAVADRAIERYTSQHPELRRGTVVSEIPAPLKWGAGIVASVMTLLSGTGLIWMVVEISEMGKTLVRMDERMANYTESQGEATDRLEQRVDVLETYHREGN